MSAMDATDLEQIEAFRKLNTQLATNLNSIDSLAQARDKALAAHATAEVLKENGMEVVEEYWNGVADPEACDTRIVVLLMSARRMCVTAAKTLAEIKMRKAGEPVLKVVPSAPEIPQAPAVEPDVVEPDEETELELTEEA